MASPQRNTIATARAAGSAGPEDYKALQPPLGAYRFGPLLLDDGVLFRLWAPSAEAVTLRLDGYEPMAMNAATAGWYELHVAGLGAGQRYRFETAGLQVPDPASRQQDRDTDGWSVVVAPFDIRPKSGIARPWNEAIICELHVGTATPAGTFAALTEHLPHFAEAGYTAIEIMPVGEYPGRNNWGYDGVLPFAPDSDYGTPQELRAMVDRAHDLGLAVILDVVYNHFGPIDNYLGQYAKPFFADGDPTPWGAAVNFTEPNVRAFFRENVRMWLQDYDFDGLRFDAMHEFRTDGAALFRSELAAQAREAKPDALLIAEDMTNAASWLQRGQNGKPLQYDAQWNDDFHHVLRVLLTEDENGYFKPFAQSPMEFLAKSLSEGFIRQGQEMAGRKLGEPSAGLPPAAFINFIQNHDQIGNQPHGGRLAERLDAERLDFMHFLVMLAPQIPMFFIGEEAHLRTRFPFFSDLRDLISDAVRQGRAAQAEEFFEHRSDGSDVPDPIAADTVEMARIDWSEFGWPERQRAAARFRELSALRRQHVWPLTATAYRGATVERSGTALRLRWDYEAGALSMVLNPSPRAASIAGGFPPVAATTGMMRQEAGVLKLAPWTAAIAVEARQ